MPSAVSTLLPLIQISRAEFVRWVCESKRPFQIVNDRAFKSLMKTGRPGYTIPSAETLSRDVKMVFTNVRQRIAKMMQVCLSLRFLLSATDLCLHIHRNTRANSTLQPTHGHPPITARLSLLPSISNTRANPFQCSSTLWSLPSPIPARTLQILLRRFSQTSVLKTRYVIYYLLYKYLPSKNASFLESPATMHRTWTQ